MSNFIRHLSVRVPWHDEGFTGRTCKNPNKNIYCNILKSIREKRIGKYNCCELEINKEDTYPPCIKENVSFMKDYDIQITFEYPYKNGHFKHFDKTKSELNKYSFSIIPFRWMMKNETGKYNDKIEQIKNLNIDIEKDIGIKTFDTIWWQCKDNQEILLNEFYKYLESDNSLCFIYSKNSPFIEDTKGRRIIIGIGRITGLGDITEYEYNISDEEIEKNNLNRALIWNRTVYHSIREDYKDGFLFPYHELLKYCNDKNDDIDFEKCTLFSSYEMFDSFSYGSEHVYNDYAIDLLYKALNVLDNIENVLSKSYCSQKDWLKYQIKSVWKLRGIYPSFGEVLCSLGIENWYEIENKIYNISKEKIIDYWEYFQNNINKFDIKNSSIKKIERMSENIKNFYYLISRISLNQDKINYLKNLNENDKLDIINNPYILYTNHDIELMKVDKAIFINENIKEMDKNHYGIIFKDYDDENNYMRLTAFIVKLLYDNLYNYGHTVVPLENILYSINSLNIDNKISIDFDDINVIKDENYFKENICLIESKDKKLSLQIKYYNDIKNIIEESIDNRIKNNNKIKVNDSNINKQLDKYIITNKDGIKENNGLSDKQKESVKLLVKNRFSILTGSAGTGKTQVIKALCSLEEIKDGNILILTPTGKSMTLLQDINSAEIKTIASFLMEHDRYDIEVNYYIQNKYEGKIPYKTIVIDEASMLSETMLASIFEVVDRTADRLILVGDYSQLPPIEEGKPFSDIIDYLKEKFNNNIYNLQENYRQMNGSKSIEFALKFRDREEYYTKNSKVVEDIEFIKWDSEEELEEKIYELLSNMNIKDYYSILESFGFTKKGEYIDFINSQNIKPSNWQILTPFREKNYVGCKAINNYIHKKFFENQLKCQYKNNFGKRINMFPTPRGEEEILCGSKVINLRNKERNLFDGSKEKKFLANGDIGLITGRIDKYKKSINDYFIIRFDAAKNYFKFDDKDFPEEGNDIIELAYALTVHKSQGSQFNKTIIVIPNTNSYLISREMIYTALTRHSEKIYILHQGDKSELNKYQEDRYSSILSRMTNLFNDKPNFEYYEKYKSFYDKNKIHITKKGEFVRSKSEVIIANLLDDKGINYEYEKELELGNMKIHPDFTVEKDGKIYIWEHLGMMDNKEYKNNWNIKKSRYEENNIIDIRDDMTDRKYYLITTEETNKSGLDSRIISKIIEKYLLL